MSTYPGNDPDDPFARPPQEDGAAGGATPQPPSAPSYPQQPPATEETAPIQREEPGYWEKLAQQQGTTPPTAPGTPPGAPDYQQNPTSAQPDPGAQQSNPWAGYGEPAAPGAPGTPAYGAGYQQPYGQADPSYAYGQPAYAGYGYVQPNHPSATTAMVLGLIGLVGGCVSCGALLLVSPFAWWVGAKARREIRDSQGQLGGQGNAQAGFVMGIIGTVLLALVVIGLAVIIIVGVSGGFDSSSSYGYSTEF